MACNFDGGVYHLNIQTQCDLNAPTHPHPHPPNYMQCAFATLMVGQSYSSSNEYNIQMNRKYVSKTAFYEGQKKVAKAVENYSNESLQNALDATEDGAILSGDGRYPIRRNSPHCTFDIINTQSNKVIALGVANKQSIHHPDETFTSTSNMLETEAMNRAPKKIYPIKDKVSGFVIDGDNKNQVLLEQENYSVIRDPNHLVLSFNNYLDKELMKYKKMIPRIPDCFDNLRRKIKKWYANLIFMNIGTDIKKTAWLNTIEHLKGNHNDCLIHKVYGFCLRYWYSIR